jgi:hypothetical protein
MFNLLEHGYYYLWGVAVITGGYTSIVGTWYACYYAVKLFQVGE